MEIGAAREAARSVHQPRIHGASGKPGGPGLDGRPRPGLRQHYMDRTTIALLGSNGEAVFFVRIAKIAFREGKGYNVINGGHEQHLIQALRASRLWGAPRQMKKLRVMTVVGTRPEVIRLSRTIAALDRHCEHLLVHTGQNYDYELNGVFFKELEIRRPDYFLGAAGLSPCDTVGRLISSMDKILSETTPDALLLLGDTNSCLAAYPAKRHKIPIFHMEAGNRCFDQRVPEEINRVIVDHIADINLPYSSIAREYLLREGIPPDRVIKTGSPLCEVIQHYLPKILASSILIDLNLKPRSFFLVSAHREENIESPRLFSKLISLLNSLAEEGGREVVLSAHPRTRSRIEKEAPNFSSGVRLCKPFGYFDYMKLQIEAAAVLSDSGTITEESNILNFPALNIREAHERPEGMEVAAVMMVGLDYDTLRSGLAVLASQPRGAERYRKIVSDYEAQDVSGTIVRIIISYTEYVNRTIWKKS